MAMRIAWPCHAEWALTTFSIIGQQMFLKKFAISHTEVLTLPSRLWGHSRHSRMRFVLCGREAHYPAWAFTPANFSFLTMPLRPASATIASSQPFAPVEKNECGD